MSTVKGRRSPNYPSLTLREAIDTVRRVYAAQHTYLADREVVAQTLGYKGLNGASLTVLGALKRYGLLEQEGDQLKVSNDAVSILELPEDNPDRVAALHHAAYTTPLFADLHGTYGDRLPVDVVLKHDLIKRKFLPKAAEEVIRIYRDNLELVTPLTADYNAEDSGDQELEERPIMTPTPQPQRAQNIALTPTSERSMPVTGKGVHRFEFPLSFQRAVSAVVTIYGEEIRRGDLEHLKKKVGDLLEGFEEEEPGSSRRGAEQPAEANLKAFDEAEKELKERDE